MIGKEIMKKMLALLLACTMLFALTACATELRGTYTNSDGLVEQSFIFLEDNRVMVSAFGINVEGTYEIEEDMIVFTYSLLNLSYSLEKSFVKSGDSIFVDGVEFVKKS